MTKPPSSFEFYQVNVKSIGRFHQILWSSQKTWTVTHLQAMFTGYLFTMFIITVAFTNFFMFCFAFFLIFPIHFAHIHLGTLFSKNCPTFCFWVCVILSSASGHCKFWALFLKPNSFSGFIFLPAFSPIHCKTFFVETPICFGYI